MLYTLPFIMETRRNLENCETHVQSFLFLSTLHKKIANFLSLEAGESLGGVINIITALKFLMEK